MFQVGYCGVRPPGVHGPDGGAQVRRVGPVRPGPPGEVPDGEGDAAAGDALAVQGDPDGHRGPGQGRRRGRQPEPAQEVGHM